MSPDTDLAGHPLVIIVLASAGRPQLLADVVADLARQTLPGVLIVVSVPDDASLPHTPLPDDVLVVHARGLTAQRNAGMDAVPDATHVFFFDDDSVVRPDYLERAMLHFAAHPDVVGLTGRVLLDGAAGSSSGPIGLEDALAAVAATEVEQRTGAWAASRELYGCNFAVRREAASGERFDERLPLYGWLEDHDYARRLMRHGRLTKVTDCVVVHRGVTSGGRAAHHRLGYSQVMNPAYLLRTGSFPLWLAISEIGRRLAKNAAHSLVHADRHWRRQRLLGNVHGFADVVRGRFTPERAATIPADEVGRT